MPEKIPFTKFGFYVDPATNEVVFVPVAGEKPDGTYAFDMTIEIRGSLLQLIQETEQLDLLVNITDTVLPSTASVSDDFSWDD